MKTFSNALLYTLLLAVIALGGYFFWPTPHDKHVFAPAEKEVPAKPAFPAAIRLGDRVFIRILKAEDKLELWFSADNRPYERYKTWTICAWSGGLGPKHKKGDGRSPEGFYATSKALLNPASRYHFAFNIGYPNAFDRANGYTGSFIMVHGNCVSAGCYAMTDEGIDEIYGLVAQALHSGQQNIPVHIFPFAMTDENMQRAAKSPDYAFWQSLKPSYDYFARNHRVPTVSVENRRYKITPAVLP